jgi:hypothetical protein
MKGLADIVPMPLPTQWGPEVQYSGDSYPGHVLPPVGAPAVVPVGQDGDFAPAGIYPAGSGSPYGYGAGYGAGIPGGYSGAPASGYNAGGPPTPNFGLNPQQLRMRMAGKLPAGQDYYRQPLLPDHMLPPALQRGNPSIGFITYRRNRWDQYLFREARAWGWIVRHGGLRSCCRVPDLGAPIYDIPPFEAMPSNGLRFEYMMSAPLTAFQTAGVFNGLDAVILQFRVPIGYDGVFNRFVCSFNGNNFVDFSGNIVWRVQVGVRFLKTLGNVLNTYGSYQTAFIVPGNNHRLISGQTVSLLANIPSTSPVANGVVTAGAFGYFYPRR